MADHTTWERTKPLLFPSEQDLPYPISKLPFIFRNLSYILLAPVVILGVLDIVSYIWFRLVHQPFGQARTIVYKQWPSRLRSTTNTPAASRQHSPEVSPKLQSAPLRPLTELKQRKPTKKEEKPELSRLPSAIPIPSGLSSGNSTPVKTQPMARSPSTNTSSEDEIGSSPESTRRTLSFAPEKSTTQRSESQRRRGSINRARAQSVGVDGALGFEENTRSPSPELSFQ